MVNDLVVEARGIAAEITDLRHLLHQHPEAGMQLPLTQQTVLDALAGLPLEVSTGTSCTSVTAVLRGGAAPERIEDRVVVLLRADMDGLPVQEETGMPFASQRDGFMHACGHDIHTATLVGAARLLCAHQSELAGDVVFMFQPGEELLQGARAMIAEGVLDAAGKRADAAYGMHVFSSVFPAGEFATRPGTLMAASDTMFVDIIGKGGHGSTPYLANDPVPVMAEVILGLQTLTAKKFSQFDPVVINVGVARAGDAANIIPYIGISGGLGIDSDSMGYSSSSILYTQAEAGLQVGFPSGLYLAAAYRMYLDIPSGFPATSVGVLLGFGL